MEVNKPYLSGFSSFRQIRHTNDVVDLSEDEGSLVSPPPPICPIFSGKITGNAIPLQQFLSITFIDVTLSVKCSLRKDNDCSKRLLSSGSFNFPSSSFSVMLLLLLVSPTSTDYKSHFHFQVQVRRLCSPSFTGLLSSLISISQEKNSV